MKKTSTYQDAVNFHGHSCPGLAIGYRVALMALRELRTTKAEDEEFVAIVENNSCSVDAIQVICGCTFGKGNLICKDYGKHVYTFFNRKTAKGIRIYAERFYLDDEEDKRFVILSKKTELTEEEKNELLSIRERRVEKILNLPEEKFIKMSLPRNEMPRKAKVFNSIRCEVCGERVAEMRIQKKQQVSLCLPCSLKRKRKNISNFIPEVS